MCATILLVCVTRLVHEHAYDPRGRKTTASAAASLITSVVKAHGPLQQQQRLPSGMPDAAQGMGAGADAPSRRQPSSSGGGGGGGSGVLQPWMWRGLLTAIERGVRVMATPGTRVPMQVGCFRPLRAFVEAAPKGFGLKWPVKAFASRWTPKACALKHAAHARERSALSFATAPRHGAPLQQRSTVDCALSSVVPPFPTHPHPC
eukprot:359366-Chlamydomonas_euryale.AAC.1